MHRTAPRGRRRPDPRHSVPSAGSRRRLPPGRKAAAGAAAGGKPSPLQALVGGPLSNVCAYLDTASVVALGRAARWARAEVRQTTIWAPRAAAAVASALGQPRDAVEQALARDIDARALFGLGVNVWLFAFVEKRVRDAARRRRALYLKLRRAFGSLPGAPMQAACAVVAVVAVQGFRLVSSAGRRQRLKWLNLPPPRQPSAAKPSGDALQRHVAAATATATRTRRQHTWTGSGVAEADVELAWDTAAWAAGSGPKHSRPEARVPPSGLSLWVATGLGPPCEVATFDLRGLWTPPASAVEGGWHGSLAQVLGGSSDGKGSAGGAVAPPPQRVFEDGDIEVVCIRGQQGSGGSGPTARQFHLLVGSWAHSTGSPRPTTRMQAVAFVRLVAPLPALLAAVMARERLAYTPPPAATRGGAEVTVHLCIRSLHSSVKRSGGGGGPTTAFSWVGDAHAAAEDAAAPARRKGAAGVWDAGACSTTVHISRVVQGVALPQVDGAEEGRGPPLDADAPAPAPDLSSRPPWDAGAATAAPASSGAWTFDSQAGARDSYMAAAQEAILGTTEREAEAAALDTAAALVGRGPPARGGGHVDKVPQGQPGGMARVSVVRESGAMLRGEGGGHGAAGPMAPSWERGALAEWRVAPWPPSQTWPVGAAGVGGTFAALSHTSRGVAVVEVGVFSPPGGLLDMAVGPVVFTQGKAGAWAGRLLGPGGLLVDLQVTQAPGGEWAHVTRMDLVVPQHTAASWSHA